MYNRIIKEIYMKYMKHKWRKLNNNNYTEYNSFFPQEDVIVGKETYGKLNIKFYNKGKVLIGNYYSIADKVEFIVGGHHNYKRISTYPFQTRIYKQEIKNKVDHKIIIESDVWIGYDCLILSGAHIGQGCVIGARSIVIGDVPPYSVYVGNKVIKKRFSEEIIKQLLSIDFDKINHIKNDSYEQFCQEEIDEQNCETIIRKFKNEEK